MAPAHVIPTGLPPRLDLRAPPSDPVKARNYGRLVELLEELGQMLDEPVDWPRFRDWEKRAAAELKAGEIDLLMLAGSDDYDISLLPEQRWHNLRRILLRRKGIG